MSSQALVSIVVCTFNGEAFLAPQLESLINQSYSEIEILVCDDRSADSTTDIARAFAEKDSRIRVFANDVNLGYNRNFSQGFLKARGEFIAVCDQDDIWKPDKIEKMMPFFKNPEAVLVHCQSVRFKDTPPDISHYTARLQFTGNDVRKLMYFNTIAGHNIIFRKQLLLQALPFPETVFYDWWLVICSAIYGKVAATNEVLTFHRFHSSNVTLGKKDERKQTRSKAEERLETLQNILRKEGLTAKQKEFGLCLMEALETLKGKNFSFPLFSFLLQHAGTIFFFKKSVLSRIKMAYRMSFAIE